MNTQQENSGLYFVADSEMPDLVLALDCHCDTLEKQCESMPDGPLKQELQQRIDKCNDLYMLFAESLSDLVDMGRVSKKQQNIALQKK